MESLQVVDEDVGNPQAVDQLQVDWNKRVFLKRKKKEILAEEGLA